MEVISPEVKNQRTCWWVFWLFCFCHAINLQDFWQCHHITSSVHQTVNVDNWKCSLCQFPHCLCKQYSKDFILLEEMDWYTLCQLLTVCGLSKMYDSIRAYWNLQVQTGWYKGLQYLWSHPILQSPTAEVFHSSNLGWAWKTFNVDNVSSDVPLCHWHWLFCHDM